MTKFMNRVGNDPLLAAIFAAIVFFILYALLPIRNLIIVLNGLFFGAMSAVVVSYWQLIVNTVAGEKPYDRVRQMTLSFVLCWIAYVGSAYGSVYLRSGGLVVVDLTSTAVFRYIAIVAALMQVTAPDFGLGIFHGRDRKALWTSLVIGLIVSAFVIFIQTDETFAPLVRDTTLFMLMDTAAYAEPSSLN